MTTYWKWILGILIVLAVIVAIPLGVHYLINNGYISGPMMYTWHRGPAGSAFDKPYRFDDWEGPRGFDGYRGWDHHGYMPGFFGPFAFFGGLLKLVIFGGLLYGAYWLGRRNARIALDPSTLPSVAGQRPSPAAPASAPKRGGKAAKK